MYKESQRRIENKISNFSFGHCYSSSSWLYSTHCTLHYTVYMQYHERYNSYVALYFFTFIEMECTLLCISVITILFLCIFSTHKNVSGRWSLVAACTVIRSIHGMSGRACFSCHRVRRCREPTTTHQEMAIQTLAHVFSRLARQSQKTRWRLSSPDLQIIWAESSLIANC